MSFLFAKRLISSIIPPPFTDTNEVQIKNISGEKCAFSTTRNASLTSRALEHGRAVAGGGE